MSALPAIPPRPRWLLPLNFGVLQWFGVRLAACYQRDDAGVPSFAGWAVTRWVLPLSGWWGRYVWIAQRGRVR